MKKAGTRTTARKRSADPARLLLLALAATCAVAGAAPPLPRAHAHNDYEHPRPLLSALDHGFCSVEADIFLVNGRLLVAHHLREVRKERTLEALYLAPLLERVKANGGRVHPAAGDGPDPGFTLLIDIKRDGDAVYPVLRELLEKYSGMLATFTADGGTRGAVTVILSGERPAALVSAEPLRRCALDGRSRELATRPPRFLYPLVSDNWKSVFPDVHDDALTDAQREKLRDLVGTAHAQGRRIRFWGTPDRPALWRELHAAGVDLIGTDDLGKLAAFLAEQGR